MVSSRGLFLDVCCVCDCPVFFLIVWFCLLPSQNILLSLQIRMCTIVSIYSIISHAFCVSG